MKVQKEKNYCEEIKFHNYDCLPNDILNRIRIVFDGLLTERARPRAHMLLVGTKFLKTERAKNLDQICAAYWKLSAHCSPQLLLNAANEPVTGTVRQNAATELSNPSLDLSHRYWRSLLLLSLQNDSRSEMLSKQWQFITPLKAVGRCVPSLESVLYVVINKRFLFTEDPCRFGAELQSRCPPATFWTNFAVVLS